MTHFSGRAFKVRLKRPILRIQLFFRNRLSRSLFKFEKGIFIFLNSWKIFVTWKTYGTISPTSFSKTWKNKGKSDSSKLLTAVGSFWHKILIESAKHSKILWLKIGLAGVAHNWTNLWWSIWTKSGIFSTKRSRCNANKRMRALAACSFSDFWTIWPNWSNKSP